jgi:hypothetical protein
MESTPNLAEKNAEALREFAVGLLGQQAQKDGTIKIKQLKIDQLTHEMGILKRWRFGRRSEQLESGQRSLLEEPIDEDLEPIWLALKAELLARSVLHADETPVPMLKPGLGRTHRAYLRSYGTTQYEPRSIVVYDFAESRSGQHARTFLGGWAGKLL